MTFYAMAHRLESSDMILIHTKNTLETTNDLQVVLELPWVGAQPHGSQHSELAAWTPRKMFATTQLFVGKCFRPFLIAVGEALAACILGGMSVERRWGVGAMSVKCRRSVGALSAHNRRAVGGVSVKCRWSVGGVSV